MLHFQTSAQYSERENKLIAIEQDQDSLPRSIFLDSTDLPALKKVLTVNSRQIWRSTGQQTQNIDQLYDIRIRFDSKEKALEFHKEYWKENSEFGPEIKKHKIDVSGTEAFRAFSGADLLNGMSARYGLQMYCYLFVVDNYFVKLYITCKKELKPDVIQQQLNSVVRKIKL